MLFNSLSFAIFLPIVFVIYWALPHKFRWIVLFISSYYFYMSWNVKYVFLIFITTFVSYLTALLIEKTEDKTKRKLFLIAAGVISFGILFFFKYFNFFQENVVAFFQMFAIQLHPTTLQLLLPVGISFYTFQTFSYVIDVYRGDVPAERHFGIYATFITFFPQLVAGPIERTSNLLPQIKKEHFFNYEKAAYGMRLMVWGFFKKLVVADVLAVYVDRIFDTLYTRAGFSLVLAVLFFTVQIYCDFSGYSDIAIGCAKLLDIDLMQNFKSPYFSDSIKEFWCRWHISLSTWFRDYVYIPLGGNRKGKLRTHINLIITFLASGLWHGANWTYIIWGLIHGVSQVLEKILIPKKSRKKFTFAWALRVLLVFIFCAFTWIFFRAENFKDCIYIIKYLFLGIENPVNYIKNGFLAMILTRPAMITVGISLALLAIYDFFSLKMDVIEWVGKQKVVIRYAIYLAMLIIIMLWKASGEAAFVYFQF